MSHAKQKCAFGTNVQSDQGLHCTLPVLLDTIECINVDQRPRRDKTLCMWGGGGGGGMNLNL